MGNVGYYRLGEYKAKMERTELLVIGAGPYSLATTAYAKSLGVDMAFVGKPLDFWKTNMPRGMILRSGPDWHLDARDVATFEAYVNGRFDARRNHMGAADVAAHAGGSRLVAAS
jgi:hypothetical protein